MFILADILLTYNIYLIVWDMGWLRFWEFFFFFLEKSEFVDYGNKVCEKTSFYLTTFFKGISEKLCQMFLGVYFCRQ